MKRSGKVLSAFILSALLVGCNAPQNGVTPAPTGTTVQGFEVLGKPGINRRKVTLPRMTSMSMPRALRAQDNGSSPLPAWTGPRLFQLAFGPYSPRIGSQVALNSSGNVFLNTLDLSTRGYDAGSGVPVLKKLSSNGQVLGKQAAKVDPDIYFLNSFQVVTEDSPEKEVYHFFAESDSHRLMQGASRQAGMG